MNENTPTPDELIVEARNAAAFWTQAPQRLLHRLADALEAVTAERDALAAVIEQARAAVERTADHGDAALAFNELADLIATAPALVLAQRDAQ